MKKKRTTQTRITADTDEAENRRRRQWWFGLGAAFVLAFLIGHPLLAADLTGTWDISCRIGPDHQILTLGLVHEGTMITGGGTIRMEHARTQIPVKVRSGTAKGSNFRFSLVEAGGLIPRPQEFVGSWFRDEMSGLTKKETFGSRIFSGNRRSQSE